MGQDRACKLILLGNGSVGKSSIVARFVQDGFQRVYQQTVGLDFFEKLLEVGSASSGSQTRVRLQVWDIGGQSVASPMLTKYIGGADIVMLCYDITNAQSFHDLSDWLRTVRRATQQRQELSQGTPAGQPQSSRECISSSSSSGTQIMLVGNKLDLPHLRQVSQAMHNSFVQREGLHCDCVVSAQSGEKVLRAFYKAAARVAGVRLSAYDLEFTDKVLTAVVVKSSDGDDNDEGRTALADAIEAEDRRLEEAKRRRASSGSLRRFSISSATHRCAIQ
jgi:small GTP-binding protein